jgi:hypothetical protein
VPENKRKVLRLLLFIPPRRNKGPKLIYFSLMLVCGHAYAGSSPSLARGNEHHRQANLISPFSLILLSYSGL